MNSIKIIRNLGLSAIIAASAALSLGLNNSAYAAPAVDKEVDKSSPTLYLGLSETMSEIDTLLSSIEQNLSLATELKGKLDATQATLSEARMASSEGAAEMLSQIEEARKAFEASVAPLLDPATVEQVSLNFTKIEFEYSSSSALDPDDDGDGISTSLEDMTDSLSAAASALDACKEATSAVKASWNLKENVK